MSGFEDKLSAILADQNAMGQIMALAQSLSGPEQQQAAPDGREDGYVPVEVQPEAEEPAGLPDLGSLLGDVDPGVLQMGMRLIREYNRPDDRNAALLTALRPFLKEERLAKMDRAIQIARLSRIIRVLFEGMKENGGASRV